MPLPLPRALLATAMTAFALALAGCGSSDETTGSRATAASGATTESRTTTGSGATTESGATTGSGAPPGASAESCEAAVAAIAELRVTGVDCQTGARLASTWVGRNDCASPAGTSRYSCRVADWACLGVESDRGVSVSCARPGRSVAFVVRG